MSHDHLAKEKIVWCISRLSGSLVSIEAMVPGTAPVLAKAHQGKKQLSNAQKPHKQMQKHCLLIASQQVKHPNKSKGTFSNLCFIRPQFYRRVFPVSGTLQAKTLSEHLKIPVTHPHLTGQILLDDLIHMAIARATPFSQGRQLEEFLRLASGRGNAGP